MLVELGLVEQRVQAVLEVLNDAASVTDVARRYGVARQTLHVWLRAYAAQGLGGLVDRSSKPLSCPHQMPPRVEARIVQLRREHPGWGSRTILYWLEREGLEPLPGRTSVDRCLVRHGLITPTARRRKRSDYKRWERSRAMELWQMDIVGGVDLAGMAEAKIVSGIDDHSRFVVCAQVVARATALPVCDALEAALARHGVPEAILTDNGKHPRLRGWRRLATTDPAVVEQWWRRWPQANLGLATGWRFDVLDLDGEQGVEALCAVLSIAPWEHPGPVARTGGGGWHLLYAPTGLGNRVGLLPGVD